MPTTTALHTPATDFTDLSQPAAQAFRILHTGFTVAPILFGLDKFTNLMVDWPKYLAPWIPNLLHVSAQTFMYGVGVIEVVAGILVALMPRYAAYVVSAWLAGIIVNLITGYGYYDIALRDFGLLIGSLALGRLAEAHYRQTHAAVTTATGATVDTRTSTASPAAA